MLRAETRDPDDRVREAYLAAVFETSESIALYSTLLGKRAGHTERNTHYRAGNRKARRIRAGAPR